jgi:hypothetical protein
MAKLKKSKKQQEEQSEDDFFGTSVAHRQLVEFHPHCYVQQLALAEAKHFDEIYAIAHTPAHGEEEESEA